MRFGGRRGTRARARASAAVAFSVGGVGNIGKTVDLKRFSARVMCDCMRRKEAMRCDVVMRKDNEADWDEFVVKRSRGGVEMTARGAAIKNLVTATPFQL